MHLPHLPLTLLLAALTLTSCGEKKSASALERERMEAEGKILLQSARSAMLQADYEAARAHIKTLRTTCPRAIEARREGILLLDSIELAAAQDELQMAADRLKEEPTQANQEAFDEHHTKVKFYHSKIQHDKAQHTPQ